MNKQLAKVLFIILGATLFFSCEENKNQFTIEGTITNADTLTLYLEQRGHSDIIILDSIKLDGDGGFVFKQNSLGYPEFYRLRLANQSINFSVDSTETITIKADKAAFATDYHIEGSPSSVLIKEATISQASLNREINDIQKRHSNQSITDQQFIDEARSGIDAYKAKTKNFIVENAKSAAAYYALFLKLGDLLIFDPGDKNDLQLFRTVATVWDTYYPNSPRAEQIKSYTLSAIASIKAEEKQISMLENLMQQEPKENKDYFTVSLPGLDGKTISTTSLAGKVVLLDFTVYQTEYSVPHNMRLNKIYEKHKPKLEIYQVSFDQQKHFWQNAAVNLPWITVWDSQSLQSPLIGKFNIGELPATFLLNKDGEIVKKIGPGEDLEAGIAKIL